MVKRTVSLIVAVIMLVSVLSAVAVPTVAAHPFTDVPEWADEYVSTVYEKGIMQGTGGSVFGSDSTLTREQLVVTLYRVSGSSYDGTMDSLKASFSDAEDISDWAYDAVEWALKEGITSGIAQGDALYFKPGSDVTRQEAAKFFVTFIDYMKLDVPSDNKAELKDIDTVAGWAREYVDRCVAAGIINGNGNGYFDPTGNTSRVAAAKMLACLPDAKKGIVFPNYNRPSQDDNDPNPTNIGELKTGNMTLVENFKVSQAVVVDDAPSGNQFTMTNISDHGWHETRVVRNEYGTYIVFVQDENLLESGTYLNMYSYAIVQAKFMIVQVKGDGFEKVYEGFFPIAGNCSPNILCGNDGMIYVVNILADPVSYFHSDLLEYSAFLAVHEFDTKTNTIKHVGSDVIPFENPNPDIYQIDGVPRVGVMNADKQHPMIDNINNTIHACFGAGGSHGVGYVSWFNYDIATHTWEKKNYNGQIPEGCNRFEYFNLFADGKGGMFGVGCRTGTPDHIETLYKKVYNADIEFDASGYMWDAVYLFAIPDMHKEEVVILDKIYEPDYTNEVSFPRNASGKISPANACTYDGGCTFLASNGYFYVFYSAQRSNYYAVYDANDGFKKIKGSKKLSFKNSRKVNNDYQLALGENTNGEMFLAAVDASSADVELELYKLDLDKNNILVTMVKDSDGNTGAIPMKIKNSSVKLKHKRLSATTTRSCSIQDNVLCIVTAMDLGGNRETSLKNQITQSYDALQASSYNTTNYLFYSIELPH